MTWLINKPTTKDGLWSAEWIQGGAKIYAPDKKSLQAAIDGHPYTAGREPESLKMHVGPVTS